VRNAFTNLISDATYYTTESDCTSLNCNGVSGTNFYAGIKEDNLYVYYYSASGKRNNNLIDAVPRLSISSIYDNDDACGIYQSRIYCKTQDTRGRDIYQRDDGYYFAKSSAQIPISIAPQNGEANLPPDYDASVISIASDYINANKAQKATNWIDAPDRAKMRFNSKVYTHFTNGGGDDYWIDNSSGRQSSATTLFSREGRASVPTITNSNLKTYTLSLCTGNPSCGKGDYSEPRYTDSGVSSDDSTYFLNFNQWFYSTTGTIVNNLLDGRYASDYYSISVTTIGVHLVFPNTGRRISDNKIWSLVSKAGTQTFNLENGIYFYPIWKEGNYCPYSGGARTGCGVHSLNQSWGCYSSGWKCNRVNKKFTEWN
jgi:hypothetical protein